MPVLTGALKSTYLVPPLAEREKERKKESADEQPWGKFETGDGRMEHHDARGGADEEAERDREGVEDDGPLQEGRVYHIKKDEEDREDEEPLSQKPGEGQQRTDQDEGDR